MGDPVSLAGMNPLSNFNIGIGTVGNAVLVIVLSVLVVGLVACMIWYFAVKKQYWLKIHTFRLVGNNPTRVAVFCAKEVPFGLAGDKLWRVAPNGMFSKPFKIIKWLPVGKFQTAPNEFWYWIRQDGEWINFCPTDIDKESHKMNIKFVQEDMRLQRLATERLLEQRLLDKSFWEKYGMIIAYVVFFLVISVAMVIIFYQWAKILDKTTPLVNTMAQALGQLQSYCNNPNPNNMTSLIPVR